MHDLGRYKWLLAALLCGVCMPFGFAPYGHYWLSIAAIAVMVVLLLRYHQGFAASYAFGLGWFGIGAWWLGNTVQQYGDLNLLEAISAVFIIGLVLGLFPALWLWLNLKLARAMRQEKAIYLLLPITAVLMEWLRGHIFTGFPWVTLGNLLIDTPAASWLSVFGVYGVAWLPVLLATASAALLQTSLRRAACISLLLAAIFIAAAPSIPPAEGPEHRAALIQPNISQDQKWDAAFLHQSMQRLATLSAQARDKVDVIVWPEAAIPFYFERNEAWQAWLFERMQTWHSTVLFGGLKIIAEDENGRILSQNSLFLFKNRQENLQFVGKHHLVPFGEYVPSWLPWLQTLVPNIGDFEVATDNGILQDQQHHFGSLICYESIFPEQARQRVQAGADVLIVVTNDAWYNHSPAAWQHLQAAQARALETGRYVLRAANTGVSAIIAPNGKIVATTPWWTAQTLFGTYHTSKRITLYQQWGDWPALLLSALLVLLCCAWAWQKREHA